MLNLKCAFEINMIARNTDEEIEEMKVFFEEILSNLDNKLNNMCSELFEDFRKGIKEISKEPVDFENRIIKLEADKNMLQN